MTFKIKSKKLKEKKSFSVDEKKAEGYDSMFIQAEMTNMNSDSNNHWKWKKGQILHQWARDKYFKIVKVEKYPSSSVKLIEITKREANK